MESNCVMLSGDASSRGSTSITSREVNNLDKKKKTDGVHPQLTLNSSSL